MQKGDVETIRGMEYTFRIHETENEFSSDDDDRMDTMFAEGPKSEHHKSSEKVKTRKIRSPNSPVVILSS